MIQQSIAGYEVSCDECSDGETFEADDWDSLLKIISEAGWQWECNDGEYFHICPACSE